MRVLIIIILLTIPFPFVFGQINYDIPPKLNQHRVTKLKEDNLSNFPFQFGVNIGSSVFGQEYSVVQFEGDFFLNISLHNKITCLGFELGKILVREHVKNSTLLTLGFLYNLKLSDKHSLRFFGGLCIAGDEFLPGYTISVKYLYSFNNYTAVTFGIMYPVGKYNQVFQLGVSFFNFYE